MAGVALVEEVDDSVADLEALERRLPRDSSEIIFGFPVVYVHNWKHNKYLYDAYVGEANDVLRRTQQHFQSNDGWHKDLKAHRDEKKLFVIGHPHFNKSLTLDIENRLIQYMSCMRSIHRLRNGRGNPQYKYYPRTEFDGIFSEIWAKLHAAKPKLFMSEQEVQDSALFKCSPLHNLSKDQLEAKHKILDAIRLAWRRRRKGQLVFVEGEAGTGKSVLMSSLFYDLVAEEADGAAAERLSCRFIINHKEQLDNFNSIFRRLGLNDGGKTVVKASTFIHEKRQVDVAFVDEAHLLCTQGNQGYSGSDQLADIMKYAKTVVIIFDEHQILTREQFVENKELLKRRNLAKKNGLYVKLQSQFRIQGSKATLKWIDKFSKEMELLDIPADPGYDLRIFDDVKLMYEAIKEKAGNDGSRLSRMLASYDWDFNNTGNRKSSNYEVEIGDWHLPWNYEISRQFTKEQSKEKKRDLSWAEQKHTIGEVGSTFTIQGFDLTYSGVILGPSVTWDKKRRRIKIVGEKSKNSKVTSRRTCSDGQKIDLSNYLVQHELRVLMTRGVKGMYIYAVDDDLREELLRRQRNKSSPFVLVGPRSANCCDAYEVLRDDQVEGRMKFDRFLPVYGLKAACSNFGASEVVEQSEPLGWLDVSDFGLGRLTENLYIVQAQGDSMNQKIADGQYCVMEYCNGTCNENDIVLAEMSRFSDLESPEGAYVIKQYTTSCDKNGKRIILKPMSNNPIHKAIEINCEVGQDKDLRIVGVLKKRL